MTLLDVQHRLHCELERKDPEEEDMNKLEAMLDVAQGTSVSSFQPSLARCNDEYLAHDSSMWLSCGWCHREYSIGLRCEIERKDPEKDYMNKNPKRAAELAAYFTHAKLQVPCCQLFCMHGSEVHIPASKQNCLRQMVYYTHFSSRDPLQTPVLHGANCTSGRALL